MKKRQILSLALSIVMLACSVLVSCGGNGETTEAESVGTESVGDSSVSVTSAVPTAEDAGILITSGVDREMKEKIENGAEYGTLCIPTSLLNGALTLDTPNAEKLSGAEYENGVYTAKIDGFSNDRAGYTKQYTAVSYVTYVENGRAVTEYSLPISTSYYSVCKSAQMNDSELCTEQTTNVISVSESTVLNTLNGAAEATVTGFDATQQGYLNSYIVAANSTLSISQEENTASFNRYTVVYTATSDMQVSVTYSAGGAEHTESVYLKSGKNIEFSSFIDGAENGAVADAVIRYDFSNLSAQASTITLSSVFTDTAEIPDSITLENDKITLVIDTASGAVTELYDNSRQDGNLVQSIDNSFLGSEDYPLEGIYAPTQYGGKLISFDVGSKKAVVKHQLLDATSNELACCYLEITYLLNSDCVGVSTVLYDFYEFGHEEEQYQHTPNMTPSFDAQVLTYNGTSPWQNGACESATQDVEFKSGNTETFAVLTNGAYGFGVYAPLSDGIKSSSGTVSLYKNDHLPTMGEYSSNYIIAVGSVDQIRSVFLANKDYEGGESMYVPAGEYDSYSVDGEYIITNEGLKAPNNNNNTYGPLVAVSDTGLQLQTTSDGVSVEDTEKHVGLFYFLWMGEHGDFGVYDNMKIMAQYSDAATNTARWGGVGAMHFFSEPLYGYYKSNDTWVMRKHVEQLINAGVDFLYIDCTNGYPYTSNSRALMKILHEYNQQGWDAPKIVFYTHTSSADTVQTIYNTIYATNYYPDTWFYLEGKPVIVSRESSLSTELRNYFTVREYQWPNDSNKAVNGWPWMSFYWWDDEVFYNDSGAAEAISVSVAQHCGTVTFSYAALYGPTKDHGRSYHNGSTSDSYDGDDSYLYGYNFQESWDDAIKADVPIVLVTGWNEWVAQRQSPTSSSTPIYFIDTFDIEFSRDCEMAKGYYFDNYYIQLKYNIAKYKGTAPALLQKQRPDTFMVDLQSWSDVQVTYKDAYGDTVQRNTTGFGSTPYVNTTGRNDIVSSKICYDSQNIYFYVKCNDTISASTAGTCLNLFLNSDYGTSGWYGYDYVIDCSTFASGVANVKKYSGNNGGYAFTTSYQAECTADGAELMITVPRSQLGLASEQIKLAFKWADSTSSLTTMEQMYTDGDTAPHGRLNYVFQNY